MSGTPGQVLHRLVRDYEGNGIDPACNCGDCFVSWEVVAADFLAEIGGNAILAGDGADGMSEAPGRRLHAALLAEALATDAAWLMAGREPKGGDA